jgi:hypothetical protein
MRSVKEKRRDFYYNSTKESCKAEAANFHNSAAFIEHAHRRVHHKHLADSGVFQLVQVLEK